MRAGAAGAALHAGPDPLSLQGGSHPADGCTIHPTAKPGTTAIMWVIKARLCGSRFAAAVAEVAIAVDDQGRHSSRQKRTVLPRTSDA
jgi:hypothetical protein